MLKENYPYKGNDILSLAEMLKNCNGDIGKCFHIQEANFYLEKGSQIINQNINGNGNVIANNNADGNINSAMKIGSENQELLDIISLLEELKQLLVSQNAEGAENATDDIDLLKDEIEKEHPNSVRIERTWKRISNFVSGLPAIVSGVNGVVSNSGEIIAKLSPLLSPFF